MKLGKSLWWIPVLLAVFSLNIWLWSPAHADEGVYRHFARNVAKDYKINPSLFDAMGVVESRYDPRAHGAAGEVGMFQVKPATVLTVTGGVDPYAGQKRTYSFGSKGPEVAKIQEALNERGASLLVDGVWGSLTDVAFGVYQLRHRLEADGIAGPRSLAGLGLHGLGGTTIRQALMDPFTNIIWAAEVLVWCRNYLGRDEPGILLTCYNSGPGSDAVRYMKKVFDEMDRMDGVKK